jgi:murein DD-endopeptidase MepM/ murein hydrolase activator NlpD
LTVAFIGVLLYIIPDAVHAAALRPDSLRKEREQINPFLRSQAPVLPKRFMVAILNEEGDYFATHAFTRWKLAAWAAGAAGALVLAVLGVTLLAGRADKTLSERELARKNAALEHTFKGWEDRVRRLETEVKDVQRRNHQLRATAFLSLPDVDYGIGGSESSLKPEGLFEFSEVRPIEWNLDRVTAQVRGLEASTAELEGVISRKQKEIAHYPSIMPVRGGWLSSSFGKRIDPFTGKIEEHPGIDISIKPGSEVYAAGAGVVKDAVTRVIPNKGYGIYIVIDHGSGFSTLYGHLSKIFVKKGQQIKRWDLIGLSGDTGKSTAPHLHYTVMVNGDPRNPINFLLE